MAPRTASFFFEFLTQNQLEWRECVPFCTRQSAIAVYDFQVYDSDASWDPDTGLPVRRGALPVDQTAEFPAVPNYANLLELEILFNIMQHECLVAKIRLR